MIGFSQDGAVPVENKSLGFCSRLVTPGSRCEQFRRVLFASDDSSFQLRTFLIVFVRIGDHLPRHGLGEGVPSTAARVAMEMRAEV